MATITIWVPEGEQEDTTWEWIENQRNLSQSIRLLISDRIEESGTADISPAPQRNTRRHRRGSTKSGGEGEGSAPASPTESSPTHGTPGSNAAETTEKAAAKPEQTGISDLLGDMGFSSALS